MNLFHLDNLSWALRNLEVHVKAQLGAIGEEGLAKFRQTYDALAAKLSADESQQDQVADLTKKLDAATERAANAEAALVQAQLAGQPAQVGEDGELLGTAAGKLHHSYATLLVAMRRYGTLPDDVEASVQETSGALDTVMMLVPAAKDEAPIEPPPVTGMPEGSQPPDGNAGAQTGDANQSTGNSLPGADQNRQATDPPQV